MDSTSTSTNSNMPTATTTGGGSAAKESINDDAAAGGHSSFEFGGMTFTVTERNEVALVGVGALGSESYVDDATGARHHFVDVQGSREAMLLLVAVREDQRRIVGIQRLL